MAMQETPFRISSIFFIFLILFVFFVCYFINQFRHRNAIFNRLIQDKGQLRCIADVLPELTSDYHFILNPDIQLTADTLSDLADWMAAHPDAVMARPGLCFPDGRPQSLPLRRCALRPMVYRQLPFLKFWEKYNRAYLMEGEDLSAPVEIEFCTGSFSAVRTAEFKAVGGFDEHYFMYVEDADLTQKMRTTGKAYLVPQYTAIHAWHRAAHRSLKPFLWQTGSLLRYFHKWGFKF